MVDDGTAGQETSSMSSVSSTSGESSVRRIGRYLIVFWFGCAPRLLSGTAYYVATNGSDSYSGLSPSYSAASNGPFRTISRACAKVKAGDTVFVRGGTYHEIVTLETSGTATHRITITNYNGESPVLDGAYTLPTGSVFYFLVKVSGDYATFSNIAIQRSAGAGLALVGNFDGATNVTVSGARETGLLGGGSYDVIEGCTATDTGNGFGINGQVSWGAGIEVQGDHNVIQDSFSYENRGEGLNTCKNSTNAVIQDSTAYNNRSYNLYVDSARDATVRRNMVYQTKSEYIMYGITIGAETALPSGVYIYNNLVMGCLANFQVDSNVTTLSNVRVAYNAFVDSVGGISDYTMGVLYRTNISSFSNSTFENNIVLEEAADRIPISLGASHSGLTLDHNCWNKAPVAAARGTGDVTGDPLLAKTGSTGAGGLGPGYFEILANSPAKDKGIALGEVTDDYFGTPRGSAPDIGAYEIPGETTTLAVSATGSPTEGSAPLSVDFTGRASGGVPPYTYGWTFGDGGTSASRNPSHTYPSPGTYTATLTGTDETSTSSSAALDISVNSASSVSLSLDAETGAPAPGQGGTTDPSPGDYSYSLGSTAQIRSIPNTDYRFSRWTGDVTEADSFQPDNKLFMDTDKSLSATFCAPCADVNGDLKITPADAQAAFDIYLGKIADPTWCQLENADADCDGTKMSPQITPADALDILLIYLKKKVLSGDCSGNSRADAASVRRASPSNCSLEVHHPAFVSGRDIEVPVIVDSSSDLRAFGFDLAFPSDILTFVRVEGSELTRDDDQLDANVISLQRAYGEGAAIRARQERLSESTPSIGRATPRDQTSEPTKPPRRFAEAASDAAGSLVLRVGGYKSHPGLGPVSGVLVTLVFRVTGLSRDETPVDRPSHL